MGHFIPLFISDNDPEYAINNKKKFFANTAWLGKRFSFFKHFEIKGFHDILFFYCRNLMVQFQVADKFVRHWDLYMVWS